MASHQRNDAQILCFVALELPSIALERQTANIEGPILSRPRVEALIGAQNLSGNSLTCCVENKAILKCSLPVENYTISLNDAASDRLIFRLLRLKFVKPRWRSVFSFLLIPSP